MNMLRKRPRQQRSRATCDAILEAAAQLFGQFGYRATTTNKVAEKAGVSIGSLYQYFPHKEALILALSERHMEESGAVLAAVFQRLDRERPGVEQTLALLIDTTVALHQHNPAMHRLLFEQTPRSGELMARFRRLESVLAAAVAGQLLRLGIGGPHPQARALLLVQAIEAQVHGAVLAPPEPMTTGMLVGEIKRLWWAALGGSTA